MDKIIDLSSYNGIVDFDKMQSAGIYKVIQRSTTKNGMLDTTANRNFDEASKRGIEVDFYKFMYASCFTESYMEMRNAIEKLVSCGANVYRMWCDIEQVPNRTDDRVTTAHIISGALLACVEMGVEMGIYCNRSYLMKLINPVFKCLPVWVARYNNTLGDCGEWNQSIVYWQYTDTGRMQGIIGNVDMSYVNPYGFN